MNFSCVISHLFYHVVQVLYHVTHFSGHTMYAFDIIVNCWVKYHNDLTLFVNYPNGATTIDITFWITVANFWNVNIQRIVFKTSNDFFLPFLKGLYWWFCSCKNVNTLLMEGIMGWILVLTRRFIPHNTKNRFFKSENISSKNPLKLLFACDFCFVDIQRFDKRMIQINFCFYIIKGWRDAPVNIIWFI